MTMTKERKPRPSKPRAKPGPKAPPPPRGSWAERLRALRDKLDLTQAEMAARVGVPARTYIAWENSQTTPSRMAQQLIRAAFPNLFK